MKEFQESTALRIMNPLLAWLIRLGLPMGPMALLTVPGRSTGLPRSTPVALARSGEGWRLIAAYGRVDWVKNLEAAGRAKITIRGRDIEVVSRRLPRLEAASILRDSLIAAGPVTRRMVGPYFDTAVDAPLGPWEEESARHPVFFLTAPVS
jgi:deazaflavin-dependent oxidoreductase (nitroreductase family)